MRAAKAAFRVDAMCPTDHANGGHAENGTEADLRRHAALFNESMRALAKRSIGGGGDLESHGLSPGATPTSGADDAKAAPASTMSFYTITTPVSLSWDRITYRIGNESAKAKVVLDGCCGSLAPGQMLAILGPSGSGKTSLLNALAGRTQKRKGHALEGQIKINGMDREKTPFRLLSAYVVQDSQLFHMFSVRETMLLQAELRLPQAFTPSQKRAIAEKYIAELGLAKCADTKIGNALIRGISGGEKKRVNIGVEMMGNPSLVFLDEPTSGLDSFQAQNVIQSLWDLTKHGRTVITTIHQPRSSIYRMFSLMCLLSEGKVMYFGRADAAIGYFKRAGFDCPEQFNPADFFLDLISIDTRSPNAEEETRQRMRLLGTNFVARRAEATARGEWEHGADTIGPDAPDPKIPPRTDVQQYRASVGYQFRILFGRAFTQVRRDVIPLIISVVNGIVFSLIVGSLYSEMEKTQKGIQDRMGALFFVTVNNAFGSLFGILNVFTVEKVIVTRELSARAYSVAPYYLSKTICETPFRLMGPLVFSVIAYPIIGFDPEWNKFFTFILIVLLLASASQALGIFLGSLSKNEAIATNVAPLVTVILLLFGGFYVNKETIPVSFPPS